MMYKAFLHGNNIDEIFMAVTFVALLVIFLVLYFGNESERDEDDQTETDQGY